MLGAFTAIPEDPFLFGALIEGFVVGEGIDVEISCFSSGVERGESLPAMNTIVPTAPATTPIIATNRWLPQFLRSDLFPDIDSPRHFSTNGPRANSFGDRLRDRSGLHTDHSPHAISSNIDIDVAIVRHKGLA
jgi:hypothetical protein